MERGGGSIVELFQFIWKGSSYICLWIIVQLGCMTYFVVVGGVWCRMWGVYAGICGCYGGVCVWGQGILGLSIIHCLGGFSGNSCVNWFHAYAYCFQREKMDLAIDDLAHVWWFWLGNLKITYITMKCEDLWPLNQHSITFVHFTMLWPCRIKVSIQNAACSL